MTKRLICALVLAAFAAGGVPAEVKPAVELTLLDTLTRLDDFEASLAGSALARVLLAKRRY